jgi:hypothetical protein
VKQLKLYPTEARRIKNILMHEEFTLERATRFGGFNLLSDWMRSTGLDRWLEEAFGHIKAHWALYPLSHTIRDLIDVYALGLKRISHIPDVSGDAMMLEKRDREKMPDFTLYYKDLERFKNEADIERLCRIRDRITRKALKRVKRPVLDFDTSVETLYGEQEGAKVSYNPHKKGRPSFQPMVCRERNTALFVRGGLRGGDPPDGWEMSDFIEEVMMRLPKGRGGRGKEQWFLARADSQFDNERSYVAFEDHRGGYVVRAKMRRDLQEKLFSLPARSWECVESDVGDIQVTSFEMKREKWSRPRRIVAIRWRDETERQGCFWDYYGYSYSAYTTNLDWHPRDIYRFYDAGADVENGIKEAKGGFGIDRFSSEHFFTNAADLQLKLIAHNLMVRYGESILGRSSPRLTASTMRRCLLEIPGILIKHGRQWILKLPKRFRFRNHWPLFRERLLTV